MPFNDPTSGGGSGSSINGLQGAYATAADPSANTITVKAAQGPVIVEDNQTLGAGLTSPIFQVLGNTAENLFLVASDQSTFGPGGIGIFTTTLLPLAGGSTAIGTTASPFGDVQATTETLTKNAIGTAQTLAATVQNTTAAAAGAQQYSGILQLIGQGWKTNAVAGSEPVAFGFQTQPVQGAATPTGTFALMSNINNAGFTTVFTVSSSGVMGVGPNGANATINLGNTGNGAIDYTSANLILVANGSSLYWDSVLFYPLTDNFVSLGGTGNRFKNGYWSSFQQIYSIATPAAAPAGSARLYADTSGGKIRLMAIFPTGAAQVLASEP